jgi:hypothetical protein
LRIASSLGLFQLFSSAIYAIAMAPMAVFTYGQIFTQVSAPFLVHHGNYDFQRRNGLARRKTSSL